VPLARLARDVNNVRGVKEASGNLDQMTQVVLSCGPGFSVLSGDDSLTLPLMAVGGHGVISVIANIVPKDTADMGHAAVDNDWKRAREVHHPPLPPARGAVLATNPPPAKD